MGSSSELSEVTREFLNDLSREDTATLKTGLPLIRNIVSFGKVTKWLAITTLGLLVGFVLLWESVLKIVAWFRPPT
ncbi:hypothetical protein [Allomesorhizobium camelthorni]|uniref:Uncharacterized protein n=1 Tax=Allomesorhizobium camelthorni TaxID=475069 RepID=A0A6G4WMP8_9HYPH|nr:hypothetical protein [Mesorhizobium camelthorni]NGO56095.1 hypothetical protein [Mesorhizobium camelthorni]